MNFLLLLQFLHSTTTIALAMMPRPQCFPSSPACLRPRLEECRSAIRRLRNTDPGYPTILGREVDSLPRSISLPRIWHSSPRNCVVKLDVVSPEVRETMRLQYLTLPAEVILGACVAADTKCGGKLLIGRRQVLELTVGYYSAVRLDGLLEEIALSNATVERHPVRLMTNSTGGRTATLSDDVS